jgi:pimeloyl-ACP methyl ester carboxylesterase
MQKMPKRPARRRRRRSRGLLWSLLALATLGFLTVFLADRRRPYLPLEDEPEPDELPPLPAGPGAEETEAEAEPPAADAADFATPPQEAVWVAGPAGNLFVRDGGTAAYPGALPVLFVHGLGGNGGQWTLQLDHLRRRRRAVALDLRGHGESDSASPTSPDGSDDYSIAALAQDVAAVADQLDLRRFVLVGHSLGGAVAIEYAGRHPGRLAGLLLVDPSGDQSRVGEAQNRAFLDAVRADPLGETESYFRQLLVGGDPEAARWVLDDLRATHEEAVLRALESAAVYQPLPALARYPGPKLSIVSDLNSLPISLHRLTELPARFLHGTGHWLMLDRPLVINELIDELIEQAEAARPGARAPAAD